MRLLEGLATLAMEQGHQGGFPHVFDVDDGTPLVGGNGAGGFVHDDVAPQAIDLVLGADVGDELQDFIRNYHVGKALLAAQQPLPLRLLGVGPIVHEVEGSGLEGHATAHHLTTLGRLENTVDLNGQAKAIQQLRTEVAFLGVHGADQHELGVVADGDALAFHVVAAHGGGVQQHVHQVVVEQVDLVDVQDAAVSRGDEAGLEVLLAGLDGLLDVQGTHQAVFGCSHGKVDDADLASGRIAGPSGLLAPLAHVLGRAGWAAVGTPRHHRNLGQQRSQRAHGGALGRALFPPHQHTADAGVDGIEQQRPLHRRLADDGSKGEPGFTAGGGLLVTVSP